MRALHLRSGSSAGQRGAAALVVTMLLFFAMVLVAVFVNRNLVFEQRTSANQYRATQAFEAAEAGLDWALARLNDPQRIDAACRPSSDAGDTSFRGRYLSYVRATSSSVPATWNHAGTPAALTPSCVRLASGWSCSCPADAAPTLTAPSGTAPAPAFTLQFMPGSRPGVIRVVATGCNALAGACLPGSAANADATAKVEVALALLPGLRNPPVATVTTLGAFDAGSAAPGVHNADPATAIAIHAGGPVSTDPTRLSGAAGAPLASLLAANDAALAGLGAERLFAATFGLDKAAWQAQPGVLRVDCRGGDCGAALTRALVGAADNALVWIDGDATLQGPLTLGSNERPLALVVAGALRLDGALALHGVLYAASIDWNDTAAGGAFVRGALLSESGYRGNGNPEIVYDAALLATLRGNSGSYARVNGSWRDF